MRPFEFRRAGSSGEALSLAGADGGHLLAGGTDLIPLLKDSVVRADRLVDIKRLDDVDAAISIADDGVRIGALAILADVAADARLGERLPLLGQALRAAATPQLRAMATVGGNLLQRPRCWYYRNEAFHCWLAGGDDCPARTGQNQLHAVFPGGDGNPCCAVHPSDLAPCLLALDAQLLLRDAAGAERNVAAEAFFRLPTPERRTETVLADEVLVAVRMALPAAGSRSSYVKAMARKAWSFALAGVAATVEMRDDSIADARLVLGGVAGTPWRARAAEDLLRGRAPSEALFERAARRALEQARPLGHNAYKIPLTRGLIMQTLRALCAQPQGRQGSL
ncbi:MAG: FAD binding domain-containing protein [Pseudomonadales bacterium]